MQCRTSLYMCIQVLGLVVLSFRVVLFIQLKERSHPKVPDLWLPCSRNIYMLVVAVMDNRDCQYTIYLNKYRFLNTKGYKTKHQAFRIWSVTNQEKSQEACIVYIIVTVVQSKALYTALRVKESVPCCRNSLLPFGPFCTRSRWDSSLPEQVDCTWPLTGFDQSSISG